jgi:tol-pal system protein YbgF
MVRMQSQMPRTQGWISGDMVQSVYAAALGAALVTLSMSGSLSGAHAAGSFGPARALADAVPRTGGAVVLAQSSTIQLEEQIRMLNGRVEELGFQMLQMQEQMRQMQEDNEFRFQSLEGSPQPAGERSAVTPEPGPAAPQDLATGALPGVEPSVTASTGGATQSGAPAQAGAPTPQLGTITFDQNGNPVGAAPAQPSLGGQDNSGSQMAALSANTPDELYRGAYNYVLSGDYGLAADAFRDYIDIYPDGGQIADAHFWLGESQFSQGSFNDAARTFLNAHQSFPSSEKAPEMLLKLGMSLAALDNRDTACATFREVLLRYPDASQAVRTKVASEQTRASC